ncbi:MAG: leucyl aminopeptidase [Actinomycetes bacterium]|nr:leucyl aminopeptidase [Actinomycetes bacterium]MDX5399366.1 leucyl aminopeptidase [Actinomycetes bacterium]MDX5450237.1 leucyl aminopeptidase [Actinomycetes bacterium]
MVIDIKLCPPTPDSDREALLVAVTVSADGPSVVVPAALDGLAVGALSRLLRTLGVKGARDEVVRGPGEAVGYDVVVFTGLGDGAPTIERLRQGAGAATRTLEGIERLDVALPADAPELVGAICEGLALGAHRFTRYHVAPEPIRHARILSPLAGDRSGEAALTRGIILAEAVCLARDLVNTSPSDLHPESFADLADAAARGAGLAVTVWDEVALESEGFGGLVAVGRGSARPPRLVRLQYSPAGATTHVALVGKGITFDSGGISLKPAKGMEDMKSDMAGAAAVLAATLAAARLQLGVRVTGWLALAENMPSGRATRPSDVITIRGGTTVEVLNTDAEGRLVLADALVAAAEDEPDVIADIATLTGAQVVALGNRVSAVMGDDETRSDVVAAADAAGEQFWPMPLPAELADSLKTPMADLANVGERNGGMLVAGLFLQRFVKGRRWAHLDIAGPALNTDKGWGYTPKGGTGVGVRTLVNLLEAACD